MDAGSQRTLALSRAERDAQFSPSRTARDAAGWLSGMAQETAAARADPAVDCRGDIAYGASPRARYDLYRPAGAAGLRLPVVVFIHGGFWQEGDKSVSGFAARAALGEGVAWVGLGYTLAPEARLRDIWHELRAALAHLQREGAALGIDPARIVLAGHSAGAHLAACALCDPESAARIAGAVLVSGVYDLAPVAASYVDAPLRLDPAEIAELSPLRHRPARALPVHVLVGGNEPEAFRLQSDALGSRWGAVLPDLSTRVAPGRDHFDILAELQDTASPSWTALRAMLGPGGD